MINENQIVPYGTSNLPVDEGPWLIFAPHADDESFGMGGTLAKAVEQGVEVHLAIMTDGALGGTQENLVNIRKQEAIKAAELLSLAPPVFLNNRDRELKVAERTIKQVKDEIERIGPKAVFFPGVFELHPDHRTTALLVWQALRELDNTGVSTGIVPVSYEVLVQSPINTLIDITSYIESKRAAMEAYKSQLDERRYIDIALALNQLRTLTLSDEAAFAEGFYCFSEEETNLELADVIKNRISKYLSK